MGLSERRVLLLILEDSHFWGASARSGGEPVGDSSAQAPNLRSVAEHMATRGYDGYFVARRSVIPFSGPDMRWWHSVYEVCADLGALIYRGSAGWCWLNVAFVLRDSWANEEIV